MPRAPPPPPLPDNGTVEVRYGSDPLRAALDRVLTHQLQTMHLRVDEATNVATVTLNEPARLNALTSAQLWEYMLVLKHAERDERINVVLWTGHGRAFSAGADLRGAAQPLRLSPDAVAWFKAQGFDPGMASGDVALRSLTLLFWDFPKISVCAVNGLAIGGAANIALANYHDVVLASTDAYFRYPFSDIGLTPELGSSYVLPLCVGFARAKHMLMLGNKLTAAEALDMGLVNEVTSPDDIVPRARAVAEALAEKNQNALRLSKRLINSHHRARMDAVMAVENEFISRALGPLRKGSLSPKL